MLCAIEKEIELRCDELSNKKISSLYFGGGTPSILTSSEINRLIEKINQYFHFDSDIEITLEANPDDLSTGFLKSIALSPINRLSIGTQSFHNEDLILMNRAHDANQAYRSIVEAQNLGFENITIDLIYGSPSSSLELWKENLDKVIELHIPHVSSYALTVEPKTALEKWIAMGKVPLPLEEEQDEEFKYMVQFLKEQGFDHYEISNFGKKGFHSKHNSAYWKQQEYLGIGPSAHSYDGQLKRSWNIANNMKYIQLLKNNQLPLESEILTEKERFNELIMIGLRTMWGVDLIKMEKNFSEEILYLFHQNSENKLREKQLIIDNDFLKIPSEYWFLADGIASDLFLV